jgi:hypothetical protein
MKNDPKLQDPMVGRPLSAADMPVRKPIVPQRPITPPSPSLTVEDMQPVPRRRPRLSGFLGNGKWAAACGLCALLGTLAGSLGTSGTIQARADKAQQRQLLAQSIDRLLAAGADVRGDLSLAPTSESYRFPRVNFSDITSTREMRKAVRIAAALPGITQLSFFNPLNQTSLASPADESVLAAVAEHFPILDTLDLSCSNISSFQAYEGKSVRHLKIVNTPLIMESFTSLKFINGITELSIGWPDRTIPKDHLLRTDSFRKGLVDSLATMIDLKKINLYDLNLDKDDREKLAKFEITTARLGN